MLFTHRTFTDSGRVALCASYIMSEIEICFVFIVLYETVIQRKHLFILQQRFYELDKFSLTFLIFEDDFFIQ